MRVGGWRVSGWTLAFCVLAVLPFVPSLDGAYVADDWFFVDVYRRMNRGFAEIAGLALTSLAGTTTTFYRPLPFLTLAAQIRLDQAPAALHAVNVLLHAVASGTLFLLLHRLRGFAPAAVATLLFAWFPRRVEAVAWLSCRPDLLAAVFSIVSLATFAAWCSGRRRVWYVASLSSWWLALLSKESVVLLPLAHAAMIASWPQERALAHPDRTDSGRSALIPFIATVPAYLLLRRAVVGAWIGGYGAEAITPGWSTISSVVKHVAYQIVPPIAMADPFVRQPVGGAILTLVMGSLAVVLGVVVWRHRQELVVRVGTAWLLATVIPVATLPVSLTTTFNDRLLYLPAFGVAILASGLRWGQAPVQTRGQAPVQTRGQAPALGRVGPVLVLVALFGAWSWAQSERWALAGRLTARTVAVLADRLRSEPAERIYLAAVPESLGGAFMLRNGVREALVTQRAARPERIVLLGWYTIDPRAPDRVPIEARMIESSTVEVRSAGPDPQVMIGTADSIGLATFDVAPTDDRYGRRAFARVHLREPGPVWVVTPRGVIEARQAARE